MGEVDAATRAYLAQPDRFADVCNYVLYGGRQVVRPGELREVDPSASVRTRERRGHNARREGRRDLLRHWEVMRDGRAVYAILGIESQSYVHRAMPVRCMLYDAMGYARQVERLAKENRKAGRVSGDDYLSGLTEDDRLAPVVTMVVYFGPDEWDAPRTLRGMLDDAGAELLPFVQDYRMMLVEPAGMGNEDFDKFATDVGRVLEYVKHSRDPQALEALVHEDERYRSLEADTARLINVVTGSGLTLPEEEGKVDMCEAIEAMRRESMEQGVKKGLEQGLEEGQLRSARGVMRALSLSATEALAAIGVPEQERARYLAML